MVTRCDLDNWIVPRVANEAGADVPGYYWTDRRMKPPGTVRWNKSFDDKSLKGEVVFVLRSQQRAI